MAKFITLKQITEEVNAPEREPLDDAEVGGEDDGIQEVQSAEARFGRSGSHIDWKPNTVNVDAIRNFYPRKGGREGSRVMMKSGVAYVVLDTHDEIMQKIQG